MRDPITDAAQDPSCLLCLTPDRGGSWWSRLRPAMPRDFSKGYRWDMLQAAMYSSLPWTNDYHFTFDFTVADDFENGSYWIMYQSNGRISFALDKDARGYRFVFGSSSFNGGVFVNAPFASSLAGRHEVTLAVEGATLRVTVDGTVYEQSGERVELSAYNREVTTSAPVTLHAVSLTDDSTGTDVWQAAYSDLYDTSNPWPSPVPRNFAEEPEAWRDLSAVAAEVGTDGFTVEITFNRPAKTASYLFYGAHFFGFMLAATNILCRISVDNYIFIEESAVGDLSGRHTLKMTRRQGGVDYYLDGTLVKTNATAWDVDLSTVFTAGRYLTTDLDGTIESIVVMNDATGKEVWSYPSEAERVRLITKTNVRTDRGGFETADASVMSRIATQLDLRGAYAEKTFIADCWFPATTNNGTLNYFPVITQGDGLSGSGSSLVVNLSVQADYRASAVSRRLQLTWADASGSVHTTNVVVTDAFFGKRHQIVGVIRPGASSAQYINELYIDGEFGGSGSGSVSSFVFGKAAAASIAPGNLHLIERDYTGFLSQSSLLYGALIFDRALSAAEIAALTPKKQPLSWAGIRDVVRRGRAQRYFAVGDVLTVATPRWTIEYEVTGFDQAEPADAALTHSMTLLPVRLVTNLQFDATEPGNPDANRAQYGCNRWDWSAIRQWLNSAAAPGEWWTAQHEYDAAPAYAATLAGFMADLPADFLSAVAPARLVTALPNADGGGSVETVDRFWLPSRTEIFGDTNEDGIVEGVQMTKYIDATDADRIKYNSAGTAAGWELRSPNRSNSYNIVNVAANGIMQELSWSSAWSGSIVPACIIA